MIQTVLGVFERIGESKWQSPSHQVTVEIETHKGLRRRSMAGLRSFSYNNALVKGPLTNKQIDGYVRDGTYDLRHQFLAEKKRQKNLHGLIPRLVYDTQTQDFIEVTA